MNQADAATGFEVQLQSMQITVRLFAILRDRAGVAEVALKLPTGASVADAIDAVFERYPVLRDPSAKAAFAVNRSYVKKDTPLADGDEVAIIPPVSGG